MYKDEITRTKINCPMDFTRCITNSMTVLYKFGGINTNTVQVSF